MKQLSLRTKAQLISDVFSLSQARYIDPSIAFELAKFLSTEFDYLPWNVFINRIKYFTDLLDSSQNYGRLQLYLSNLVEPYYRNLGWDDDKKQNWLDRSIRNPVIQFACQQDLSDCIKRSSAYFKDWISTNDISKANIPTGLRTTVLCTSIRHGSENEFNFAFNTLNSTKDNALKRDIINGLSCSKESWRLKYLLDTQLADLNNSVDPLGTINNIAIRSNGYLIAWNGLKDNWNKIYER